MSKSKSADIWMPVYIKDRRAHVSTMSHLEHSAYDYLMLLLWERGGVIQDDERAIAKAIRVTPKQWKQIRPTLLADCTISGGLIQHQWTLDEVAKAKANIAQKRQAGIASAAARKGNARSTDVTTYVQPRAGEGGGVLADRKDSLGSDTSREDERNPFDVIRGGRS